MDVRPNAAAVVRDRHRLVRMDRDDDAVAMARQRLVDGVIHNLENHVVKSRAVIGVTDVHAGSFAHRVKTLQDLDFAGIVDVVVGHDVLGKTGPNYSWFTLPCST